MALRTWWLQNRLRSVERTLKRLRARQRQLREKESALAKEKRGLTPEEVSAREAKLHEEREAVTRQVNEAVAREDALKRELSAADGMASSS